MGFIEEMGALGCLPHFIWWFMCIIRVTGKIFGSYDSFCQDDKQAINCPIRNNFRTKKEVGNHLCLCDKGELVINTD